MIAFSVWLGVSHLSMSSYRMVKEGEAQTTLADNPVVRSGFLVFIIGLLGLSIAVIMSVLLNWIFIFKHNLLNSITYHIKLLLKISVLKKWCQRESNILVENQLQCRKLTKQVLLIAAQTIQDMILQWSLNLNRTYKSCNSLLHLHFSAFPQSCLCKTIWE